MQKRMLALGMVLICLLLWTGCGKLGTASQGDEEADALEERTLERMGTLTADDIKWLDSPFSSTSEQELADAMREAVAHRIDFAEEEPPFHYDYYTLTAYLSGGPEGYSSEDEQFHLFAGLEEDFVTVRYHGKEGENATLYFSDGDLYRLIRSSYHREDVLDEAAYAPYRERIEARAQEDVDRSGDAVGAAPFNGYEVVAFTPVDAFETAEGSYAVYAWDAAFLTDDPDAVCWAGGMYLDAEARVRAYEQETYFAVKREPDGTENVRFLFWDLFAGPDEETGRANARSRVEQAFVTKEG